MGNRALEIQVSARQRALLESWIRKKADTPYRLVERSRMVLMSSDGVSNVEHGRQLGVSEQRPRRWRRRWSESQARLAEAEEQGASAGDLGKLMLGVLSDEPRAGVTPKFSAEQLTKLIAIACECPQDCDRPVTHWTPFELADEATKRGIVPSISPRHVDRILKGGICALTRANTG